MVGLSMEEIIKKKRLDKGKSKGTDQQKKSTKGQIIVVEKDLSSQLVSHLKGKSIRIVIRETVVQQADPPPQTGKLKLLLCQSMMGKRRQWSRLKLLFLLGRILNR